MMIHLMECPGEAMIGQDHDLQGLLWLFCSKVLNAKLSIGFSMYVAGVPKQMSNFHRVLMMPVPSLAAWWFA